MDLGVNTNIDLSTTAGQARASLEWKSQIESGYKKQLDALRDENKLIKQNLISVQSFIVDTIN